MKELLIGAGGTILVFVINLLLKDESIYKQFRIYGVMVSTVIHNRFGYKIENSIETGIASAAKGFIDGLRANNIQVDINDK